MLQRFSCISFIFKPPCCYLLSFVSYLVSFLALHAWFGLGKIELNSLKGCELSWWKTQKYVLFENVGYKCFPIFTMLYSIIDFLEGDATFRVFFSFWAEDINLIGNRLFWRSCKNFAWWVQNLVKLLLIVSCWWSFNHHQINPFLLNVHFWSYWNTTEPLVIWCFQEGSKYKTGKKRVK